MKHKLFSIFLLLPLLCGCEYVFELDKMEGESRLQMICLAGNGDNTYFKVNKAAAVNSRDTDPAVIEKMEFTINGQSREIGTNLEDGYYLVNSPVKAGDKIGLYVKAAGMKEASSETVIPEKVAVASIKAEFKREFVNDLFVADIEDNLYFDVELDGKVSEDDYFAVEIKAHCISSYTTEDGSEHVDEYEYHESIHDDSDFLSFESGKGSGWFSTLYSGMRFGDGSNSHYLFMTSGKSVVDGHLIIKTWFNNNYVYEDPAYNISERGEYRYQLVLYKVSPECYRYCKARYLQSSNVLVEAGLSPATFSYTNVRNGFGVVGAISEPVYSEWYLNPER